MFSSLQVMKCSMPIYTAPMIKLCDSWRSGILQLCSKKIDDSMEFPFSYHITASVFVITIAAIQININARSVFESRGSWTNRFSPLEVTVPLVTLVQPVISGISFRIVSLGWTNKFSLLEVTTPVVILIKLTLAGELKLWF